MNELRLLDTNDSLYGVVVEKEGKLYFDYGGSTLLPTNTALSINPGRPLQLGLKSEIDSTWRNVVDRCHMNKGTVTVSFINDDVNREALVYDDPEAVIRFRSNDSETDYTCLRNQLPFYSEAYLAHLWLKGIATEAKYAKTSNEKQAGTTPIIPLVPNLEMPKVDDVVEAFYNANSPSNPNISFFAYGQFGISVVFPRESLKSKRKYSFGDAAKIHITKIDGKRLFGVLASGISREHILPAKKYSAVIDSYSIGRHKETPQLKVRIEGNLFPVRLESIPNATTRLKNYMYPIGSKIEVITSEDLLEDNAPAYVDIADLTINYPFKEGITYPCYLDNYFINISKDSHDYHFYISPEEQMGTLHKRLFKVNSPETRKILFEVQFRIEEYGDPIILFKSLIQKRLREFPDGFVFPARVLSKQNSTIIWQYQGIIGLLKIQEGSVPNVGEIVHLTLSGYENGLHQFALVSASAHGDTNNGSQNMCFWGYVPETSPNSYREEDVSKLKGTGVLQGIVIGYDGKGHYIRYNDDCIGYLPNDNIIWGVCYDAYGYFRENESIDFCFSGVLNHGFPELSLLDLIFKPHVNIKENELLSSVILERIFPTALQVRYGNLVLQISDAEIDKDSSSETLEHLFSPKEKLEALVIKGGRDAKSIRFSLKTNTGIVWRYCPLREGDYAIGRVCEHEGDTISVVVKRYLGSLVGNNYGVRDGQLICVKIENIDTERGLMSCSFAGIIPDTWDVNGFTPGRIHDATIEQLFEDGGVAVRVKGFYGEIEASDFGPDGRNEVIKVGDIIKVMVIDTEPAYLRLRLSYQFGNGIPKEFIPFKLGDKYNFRISEVFTGGATEWLKLEVPNFPLIHGMVPQKELEWVSSERDAGKYRIGDNIEAIVYEIRPDISAFKASIRRIHPDTRSIEQLNINEKLNVTVVHFFPEKNYVSVKYGNYSGILEVDSGYWRCVKGAQDGFFRNNKEIEACLKSKDKDLLVFTLPENEYLFEWDSDGIHEGDILYGLDIIDVCSSYLFVKYDGLVIGMSRSQLSWFKTFPFAAFYSIGDTIDALVNFYRADEHIINIQIPGLESFDPLSIPLKVGNVYHAEFLSKGKDGFHLRCNSVPVLLPTLSFARGITPMVIEDGILVKISEIDVEGHVVLATCDAESIPDPISNWREGAYVNLKVQKSSSEKGVLLMHKGYAAVIPIEQAQNGVYDIEECYHYGDDIVVRIVSINGSHIIVAPNYYNSTEMLPPTMGNNFEADICWKSPSVGIVVRHNDVFYIASVQDNFNQPYEQIAQIGDRSKIEVIPLEKEINGLPCVQLAGFSSASAFNLVVQCGDVISVKTVGHVDNYSILFYSKESLFLLMDRSEIIPSNVDEFKVRVLSIEKSSRRIIVSHKAVRNNPTLYLIPGEKYKGRLVKKGETNYLVSVNPNGAGTVTGFVKGKIAGHYNNEVVDVFVERVQITDTRLGGKSRMVLFSFDAPSKEVPFLGRRVKCTMKPGKSGPCTFRWNSNAIDAYLPATERFWYNDNRILSDFMATIIGRDENGTYLVSHKSCFINPLLCCTEGETINAKVVNVVVNDRSKGVAVEYNAGIAFIPLYEMSFQKIDLPQKKWTIGQTISCVVTKCNYDSEEPKNNVFRLSHKLTLSAFDFSDETWRCKTYSALVLRVGKEGNANCVVVKLDDIEIEASITQKELTVFNEGLSEKLPEPNYKIAEVGIKDVIFDNYGVPHVFAYVIRKKW